MLKLTRAIVLIPCFLLSAALVACGPAEREPKSAEQFGFGPPAPPAPETPADPTPIDDPTGTGTDPGAGPGVEPGPVEPEPEPEPEDPGPPAGPLDACHATATGALGEDSDPIQYHGQPVQITATHNAGQKCLTGMELVFTVGGACPLTLQFGVEGGLWALTSATLRSDPQCGNGWGSGKTYATGPGVDGTLLAAPLAVANGDGDKSCTQLLERLDLAGVLSMTNGGTTIEVILSGLGVEGNLLSSAIAGGTCGASPQPCNQLECGLDPLFGQSCGSCGEGLFCLAGACVEGSPAQEACARYNHDRALMSEDAWGGSINQCVEATMSEAWQQAALLNVNLYRWFAGLPPLALNPALYAGQQKCALILDANNSLSHNPPSFWKCWSQAGSKAAGGSNIATMPAVIAGDLYMIDPGNETTMGHRRWILSNWLSSTAFGSTKDYSCMATKSGGGGANAQWTAWPPAGYYPVDWHAMSWTNTDETGWTIQSDSINLSNAKVTVTEGGQNRPMSVIKLKGGYGSDYAINMVPQGWKIKAGATYTVSVTGTNPPISYEIHSLDCSTF